MGAGEIATAGDGTAPLAAASSRVERIRRILEDLVAFDTVSARSNLDCVRYITDLLAAEGIDWRLLPDPTGEKAAILASIGPEDRAGVVLSAHTDVVPVEGQDWSSPPFALTEHDDGRLYGRGSTDMKGFVAVVLGHLDQFKAAAREVPVHIALSYDEELGCRGADDLVAAVAGLPQPPFLCLVGEPTGMRVAHAHKGKVARRLTFHGRGGHSALTHLAANAVEAAAGVVAGLSALAEELERGVAAAEFDPPYSTVHVGSFHGGGALNLVPDVAVVEFEIRYVPGTDVPALLARVDELVAEALARLRRRAPDARVEQQELISYPGLETPSQSPAAMMARELADDRAGPLTIAFGTEAGLYAAAGVPTIVCGPGDIARAHKADEWVGTDELAAMSRMLDRLADNLSRPASAWAVPPRANGQSGKTAGS